MLGWEGPLHAAAAFAAGAVAGGLNALAGGGTNISFPVLLWLGLPAIEANATNSVALMPGSLGGFIGFRRHLHGAGPAFRLFLLPALIGGTLGAALLVHTPERFFRLLAPALVLGSTVIIALDPAIRRRLPRSAGLTGSRRRTAAVLATFGTAVYGGYFGAGIGILLLATLSLVGLDGLHRQNGLKNLLAVAIKGAAIVYLIASGRVVWHAALAMGAGAVLGGLGAAEIGGRMREGRLRVLVVALSALAGLSLVVKLR